MVLSEEDFPENWTAYDKGNPGFNLCNNSVEFHYAPQGDYNEYLPQVKIVIAIYEEDITFPNGTVWSPIRQSEWIYEAIKEDNKELTPIDLGEEGYYFLQNYSFQEVQYTTAIYAFRAKNVWVHFNFIEVDSSYIPYWGWMEDIVRLQESRILG